MTDKEQTEALAAYEQRRAAADVQRQAAHEDADAMWNHIAADAREELNERMAEIEKGNL